MNRINLWLCALAITFLVSPSLLAGDEIQERVENSIEVYKELINAPDQGVPEKLLDGCQCVAVIPHVVKAAFVFGGRHGRGVVSCRDSKKRWSPPAFVRISGGSFGLQIGGQATDFVLFIMNQKGARSLLKSKFTLGGDASVAAGPVGRTAEGGTDIALNAEIYAYARAKGLFAGISLEGANLGIDEGAIREFYGQTVPAQRILFEHKVPRHPKLAVDFVKVLP